MELGLLVGANVNAGGECPTGTFLVAGSRNGVKDVGVFPPSALTPFVDKNGSSGPLVKGFGETASAVSLRAVPAPTQVSVARRTKAGQRMAYVRAVKLLAREHGLSEEKACQVEAETNAELYDLLKGKLNYFNFRTWKRKIGESTPGKLDFGNVHALIDDYRGGRQMDIERFALYREFVGGLLRMFAHKNKFDLAGAYRLCQFAARRDGRSPDDIPSIGQVAYYLEHRVPAVWLKCRREGEEYTQNRLLAHVTRNWSEVRMNQVWFGDNHTFDAMVRVPCAEAKSGWRALRPTAAAIMDGKSGRFIGLRVLGEEHVSNLSIQDATIDAIRFNDMRPALEFYFDNGKDYQKQGFTEPLVMPDGSEHCICRELGMSVRTALPYRARSKLIERAFVRFAKEFAKLWGSYRGSNTADRPEGAQYYEAHPELLPTVAEFEQMLRFWLDEIYHTTAGKKSRVSNGRTPDEMWGLRTPLREPLTLEQLWFAMLLPVPKPHMIYGGGVIRFGGEWLAVEAGQFTGRELWPLVGTKSMMLKIDRMTKETFGLVAFTVDGKLLCPLRRKGQAPALCQTDEDYETLQVLTREANAMRPWLRDLNVEFLGRKNMEPAQARLWLSQGAPEGVSTPVAALPPAEIASQPKPVAKSTPVSDAIRSAMAKAMFGPAAVGGDNPAATSDPTAGADVEAAQLKDALARLEM